MTSRTALTMIKLSSIIFISIAMVFAVKYHDSQNKYKKLKEAIQIDKKTYSNDLREIFNLYDSELLKNKKIIQYKNLKKENETVSNKRDLKNNKNLDNPVLALKNNFIKKIDSLNSNLKAQTEEKKHLENQLIALINKNKELQKHHANNENTAAISKNLKAIDISAKAIQIASNSIIETNRLSKTEQIKVCFTLLENKAALKGNKDLYIQILNPNNKIVNKNGEIAKTEDKLLNFSAKTNVFYDNDKLDVCLFVDPNKDDMQKGDYKINIFSGINLIGNTVFSLK
ncbi:hypothetical protein [Flavobacterium psychrophilum]|uniref:hypothetical protein n=1 Tax=Flavobacterium psychrophilum TaxID=96345 RepID=UPI001C8F7506|nr:hypothetical protein [Flavobacterium psychrophilum]QZK97057.1 hypothetical protein K5L05_06855 [Flavobacterium psychrophilum]